MDLSEIPLFSELDSEEINKVSSLSRQVNYKKDEYIFHEGDAFQGLFIVLKGSVKIFKISPHGKEYILHLLRENQLFGD
ncbi:MAG: Crp/Fnr family transcriptional regulator, partial [Acidobacteriota bacterium]